MFEINLNVIFFFFACITFFWYKIQEGGFGFKKLSDRKFTLADTLYRRYFSISVIIIKRKFKIQKITFYQTFLKLFLECNVLSLMNLKY